MYIITDMPARLKWIVRFRARYSHRCALTRALVALAVLLVWCGIYPVMAAPRPLGRFLARYDLCIANAAWHYRVPRALIIAVLMTEDGRPGTAHRDADGTVDYGPMQINTVRLAQLRPYGLTIPMLRYDACTNIWSGTYLLALEIRKAGNFWTGVAHYHSRTPSLGRAYAAKVYRNWTRLVRHTGPRGVDYAGLHE